MATLPSRKNIHKSTHSWQRGPNPPILWRPPYIAYPPPLFFKFSPPSSFPVASNPHAHCSFWCLASLAEWVIMPHLMCYFIDIMDLHMSSFGTLIPEGPWCVFYATRRQVYWGLTYSVVFCWYFDLISYAHNDTQGPVDWHTHINIYLHHLCAHSSYLPVTEWIIQ